MKVVILLFLTLPLVFSAPPKCPEGFPLYFKRTPTVKNNHTKNWCIGVFEMEDMGNRDRARSTCIYYGASLTIPESKAEFDVIAKHIQKRNISNPHAMDGEITPRCKAQIFRSQQNRKKFNETTEKGECNIKNHMFNFDDVNSDPTYVLSNMAFGVPNGVGDHQEGDNPMFRHLAGCLKLDRTHWEDHTGVGVSDLSYCVGKKSMKTYTQSSEDGQIDSVICGRRPL